MARDTFLSDLDPSKLHPRDPLWEPRESGRIDITILPSPGVDDLVTALQREQERVAGEVLRTVDERLAALPPGWRVAARLALTHGGDGTRIELRDIAPDDSSILSPEWMLFERREQLSCGCTRNPP